MRRPRSKDGHFPPPRPRTCTELRPNEAPPQNRRRSPPPSAAGSIRGIRPRAPGRTWRLPSPRAGPRRGRPQVCQIQRDTRRWARCGGATAPTPRGRARSLPRVTARSPPCPCAARPQPHTTCNRWRGAPREARGAGRGAPPTPFRTRKVAATGKGMSDTPRGMKICVVGPKRSGKTTMCNFLSQQAKQMKPTPEYAATAGCRCARRRLPGEEEVTHRGALHYPAASRFGPSLATGGGGFCFADEVPVPADIAAMLQNSRV